MTDLPEPLVPSNVDLGGYGFMPLHGHRLFGSDFNARCNDAEWRAGVTLWWASWNQVPAGSLPDDDVVLCRLAGFGRDLRTWRKLRENSLRGFIRCSDGRLYHAVIAKLALEAWERRVKDRERKAKWRERINLSGDGNAEGDGDGDGDTPGDGAVASPLKGEGEGEGEGEGQEAKREEANREGDAGATRPPRSTPKPSDPARRMRTLLVQSNLGTVGSATDDWLAWFEPRIPLEAGGWRDEDWPVVRSFFADAQRWANRGQTGMPTKPTDRYLRHIAPYWPEWATVWKARQAAKETT